MGRLYGNGRKFGSFSLNLSHFLYRVCICVCVCSYDARVSMYVCVYKHLCIFVCTSIICLDIYTIFVTIHLYYYMIQKLIIHVFAIKCHI